MIKQLEVEVGGQLALVADIEEVTWSSSDNLIATVSQAGVVEGVAAGTVTITASKSGYNPGTIEITVVAAAPSNEDPEQGA